MSQRIAIKGGPIVQRDKLLRDKCLVIEEGRIIDIVADRGSYDDMEVVDAEGNYISPGLIELHIHGCGKHSFEDLGPGSLQAIADYLEKRGITSFLPTMQCEESALKALAEEIVALPDLESRILGIYIEGPFISKEKKGGVLDHTLKDPDPAHLDHLVELCQNKITMMTIAPELEGIHEIQSALRRHNILPSFGHTNCHIDDAKKLYDGETTNVTHLFNAMSPLSHKTPGMAFLPFLNREVFFELNSDGVHVNPESIQLCHHNLNKDRMILMSDAVISAGLEHGKYCYYQKDVNSSERGVRYDENDTLLGSNHIITMVLAKYIEFTGAPVEQAIYHATTVPCELLGIGEDKGSLEVGKRAEVAIFDRNFNCKYVIA